MYCNLVFYYRAYLKRSVLFFCTLLFICASVLCTSLHAFICLCVPLLCSGSLTQSTSMSHIEGAGQTWSKKSLRWDPDILHHSNISFLNQAFLTLPPPLNFFSAAHCQPYPLAFLLAWTVMWTL